MQRTQEDIICNRIYFTQKLSRNLTILNYTFCKIIRYQLNKEQDYQIKTLNNIVDENNVNFKLVLIVL